MRYSLLTPGGVLGPGPAIPSHTVTTLAGHFDTLCALFRRLRSLIRLDQETVICRCSLTGQADRR
jgi:hypothetical protein